VGGSDGVLALVDRRGGAFIGGSIAVGVGRGASIGGCGALVGGRATSMSGWSSGSEAAHWSMAACVGSVASAGEALRRVNHMVRAKRVPVVTRSTAWRLADPDSNATRVPGSGSTTRSHLGGVEGRGVADCAGAGAGEGGCEGKEVRVGVRVRVRVRVGVRVLGAGRTTW